MDFIKTLTKLQETPESKVIGIITEVEATDDDTIDAYLQKKGKVRKKGYAYKLDKSNPNAIKIVEVPASQLKTMDMKIKQNVAKIKGVTT